MPELPEQNAPTAPARFRRGVVTSAVNNGPAFGYSILITSTFGLLQTSVGDPSTLRVVLFALSAALPFSIVETITSRGFRRAARRQGEKVVMLGTATNLISVAASLGVAYLAMRIAHDAAAWAVTPFVAGMTYIIVEALELSVAEAIESRLSGEAEAEGDDDDQPS